jgi:hypothetical protein
VTEGDGEADGDGETDGLGVTGDVETTPSIGTVAVIVWATGSFTLGTGTPTWHCGTSGVVSAHSG